MAITDYIKILHNVFPHELCDLLIHEHDSNLDKIPDRKHSSSGCPEPMAIFTNEVLNLVDPVIELYLNTYLQDKMGEDPSEYVLDSLSILRYGKNDGYKLHPDNPFTIVEPEEGLGKFFPIQIIVYLNDNFNGGEIEFPDYGVIHKPKKGDICIFPTGFAFPHKVHEVDADRYIMLCAVMKVGKDYIDR